AVGRDPWTPHVVVGSRLWLVGGEPRGPVVGRVAEADAVAAPHERRAEQPRLGERALEHALGRITADVQAERAKARVLTVDQRGRARLCLGPAARARRPRRL